MKKSTNAITSFIGFALLLVVALSLTACGKRATEGFTIVERTLDYAIRVDNETGVMYLCNVGTTPLYNADGSLRIYGENAAQPTVADTYPAVAFVGEIDYANNIVFCADYLGNRWAFVGTEDWMLGDIVAMTVDSCGTDIITDDEIIDVRYAGSIEVG